MAIVQLTHLLPREGKVEEVARLIEEWGAADAAEGKAPAYAFLCRDEEHLFVVSMHESVEAYNAQAEASAAWLERLTALLVDPHGPTFYGEVLAQQGDPGAAVGGALPGALRVGKRH